MRKVEFNPFDEESVRQYHEAKKQKEAKPLAKVENKSTAKSDLILYLIIGIIIILMVAFGEAIQF